MLPFSITPLPRDKRPPSFQLHWWMATPFRHFAVALCHIYPVFLSIKARAGRESSSANRLFPSSRRQPNQNSPDTPNFTGAMQSTRIIALLLFLFTFGLLVVGSPVVEKRESVTDIDAFVTSLRAKIAPTLAQMSRYPYSPLCVL
jgi:hypothetical protein